MSKIFNMLKKAEKLGPEGSGGRPQVNLNLSTMVDNLSSERQTRPLACLEPEQQKEVWKKAVEAAPEGKATAKLQEQKLLEETDEIILLEEKDVMIEDSHHLEMTYAWLTEQRRGEERTWASIQKRRIRWEPVLEATSYVVYVSIDRTVFDPEMFRWKATHGVIFKAVIGKTELILPDEWPEFPGEQGIYYIGITAKDDVGNESSPFMLEGIFKFIPPQRPSNGGIEYL